MKIPTYLVTFSLVMIPIGASLTATGPQEETRLTRPQVVAAVVADSWDRNGDDKPDGDRLRGVYRTTSSGDDWTDITGSLYGSYSQIFHAQAIAIHPSDPSRIYVASNTLATTQNAGSTWTTPGNHGHDDITQLTFSPLTGDSVLWITNDGGLYQAASDLGSPATSWNGGSAGLAISQIWYGDADRATRVAGLQDNGSLRSIDRGQTWTFIGGGDAFAVEIVEPEQSRFWYSDGIYASPSIRVKRMIDASPEEVAHPGASNPPLLYEPRNDRMFSASAFDLVSRNQSGDANAAWTVEASGLSQSDVIWEVFGSPVDGATVFVIYYRGGTIYGGTPNLTVCRKVAGSWTVTHRNAIVNGEILAVLPSPLWPNEFWVAVGSNDPNAARVLHTTDDGATWTAADDANLRALNRVSGLAASPYNPLELYAATDIGVFRTLDGGQNWAPFQDGLPISIGRDLRFVTDDQHQGNHRLVLFTFGSGTWERVIPGPAVLYVDPTATGFEDGTFEHPFNTVAEAINAAPAGAVVMIRAATYTEPQTATKNVTLITYSGTTVIR